MSLSSELRGRNLVHQHSSGKLEDITDGPKRTIYWGVDPSADSMHVGQLQGILVLRRFLEDGHKLIIIVGGGTGMIGDPGGRSTERNLLDDETVRHNAEAINKQFSKLFGGISFKMVNNAQWLRSLNLMEFLRDVGKHFTVNEMVKRDSVRPRLESPDASISFTEFSYMLLQAYDFWHLFTNKNVEVQVGGSDQWGNIVSGVDFIRRKTGKTAYAFTWPLLINKSTGKKFGKSEGGAVWLDDKKTSPYQFYQFFLNNSDDVADIEDQLKKLTMLPFEEVDTIMVAHKQSPEKREAQKRLAREVTTLVHGEAHTTAAEAVSNILFGNTGLANVDEITRDMLVVAAPNTTVPVGESVIDVLVRSGLAQSKREARQFLQEGAVMLNGVKISDLEVKLPKDAFSAHGLALLKRGKREVRVLVRG